MNEHQTWEKLKTTKTLEEWIECLKETEANIINDESMGFGTINEQVFVQGLKILIADLEQKRKEKQ